MLQPVMVIAYQQLRAARRQLTKNPEPKQEFERVFAQRKSDPAKKLQPGVVNKLVSTARKLGWEWESPSVMHSSSDKPN